jgi:tetratricopeptide (TPR) repeat protein
MSSIANSPDTALPAPDAIRAELHKLLTSPAFATSPSLSRFLSFIIEESLAGRASQLKEYAIGVCVLGRADDYDPRLDPIVRVQARNLRNRLKSYYELHREDAVVLIELPKGTYVPTFAWVAHGTAVPSEIESPAPHSESVATVQTQPMAYSAPPAVTSSPPPAPRSWIWAGLVVALAALGALGLHWLDKKTDPPQPPAARSARNPEAQRLYARGMYFYNEHSEDSLRRSIGYFERAIAADADFAPAHAGLAEALNVLVQYGHVPPREGMPRAKTAALRALELDPNLPDAHMALGAILEAYDWDFKAARREFRKAVELGPNHARARLWYGLFLLDQGSFEEAVPEIERAHQLDPISPFVVLTMASVEMHRGRRDAALELFNSVLEMQPLSPGAHVRLAMLYRQKSRVPESLAAIQRARELGSESPKMLVSLASIYQHWGMKEEARRVLADLERMARRKYVSPFHLAMVYDRTGDAERAFHYLEKAYEERAVGFAYFKKQKFHSVQSHPRFKELLDKATHASFIARPRHSGYAG